MPFIENPFLESIKRKRAQRLFYKKHKCENVDPVRPKFLHLQYYKKDGFIFMVFIEVIVKFITRICLITNCISNR